MLQKGFAPILIILFLTIVLAGVGGVYYFISSNFQQKSVLKDSVIESTLSAKVKPTQATISAKLPNGIDDNPWAYKENGKVIFPCHLSIAMPANWKVLSNPSCIDLAAPDYKIVDNPRPGILSEKVGLNLIIGWGFNPTKTKKFIDGALKDIMITDIDSYIDSKREDYNQLSDVEDRIYGTVKGKFFTNRTISGVGQYRHVSDFPINNFVFSNSNIIYHAYWQDRYVLGNEKDLEKILNSIEFVKY
jgi:hypothetical protein